MTCVVAVKDDCGGLYMGGDSASVDYSLDLTIRADQKLFQRGGFLIGSSGSWRVAQLVEHSLKLQEPKKRGVNLSAWMATAFVDAFRKCLKEGGALNVDKDTNIEHIDGDFLVGFRGRLFVIYEDFQIAEPQDNFAAVGCGAPIALGSLYSTKKSPPEQRLVTALRASERFSAGVRGPFVLKKIVPPVKP